MPLRPVWAEVDLGALGHNVGEVRRLVGPKVKIMAVVKANAYGHGAAEVARAAVRSGADWLGVATPEEAFSLREEGVEAPILVLGYVPYTDLEELIRKDVSITVFSLAQAKDASRVAARRGAAVRVHVKIDTGMMRIGFLPGRKTEEEIFQLASLPGVVAEGIFTHFALADAEDKSFTREQLKRFLALVSSLERGGLRIPLRHAANSAAIIDIPETHLDMVRAGIMIYGLFPSPEVSQNKVELRPVMSWKSRIILVKEVGAGTGISYGHTFITARKSLIATVPLGYADGFSRLLSNKACVLVRGRRVPVVGRICMDQFMADVTGVEGVAEGDEVVIFGRQGQEFIGVDELARTLGTINYEVVCMVSSRVPRRYTGA